MASAYLTDLTIMVSQIGRHESAPSKIRFTFCAWSQGVVSKIFCGPNIGGQEAESIVLDSERNHERAIHSNSSILEYHYLIILIWLALWNPYL